MNRCNLRLLGVALMVLSMGKANAAEPGEKWYVGGGPGVGINYFTPDFELFSIPDAAHGA